MRETNINNGNERIGEPKEPRPNESDRALELAEQRDIEASRALGEAEQTPVEETSAARRSVNERRFDRQKRIIEKKKNFASAALSVEQTIFSWNDYDTTLPFDLDKALDRATEALREIEGTMDGTTELAKDKITSLKRALVDYQIFSYKAQEQENRYAAFLKTQGIDLTPESLGNYLYYSTTFETNADKITAKREGPFFVFTFENNENFNRIVGDQLDRITEVRAGGYYINQMSIEGGAEEINAILCNNQGQSLERNNVVLTHERQHFINNRLLNFFSDLEAASDTTKNYPRLSEGLQTNEKLKYALRYIKDEVLAYLRDAAEDDFAEWIKRDIYKHLLEPLTPQQIEEVYSLLLDIQSSLGNLFGYDQLSPSTDADRATMVYSLIDVPLTKFPKWLEAFLESKHGPTPPTPIL